MRRLSRRPSCLRLSRTASHRTTLPQVAHPSSVDGRSGRCFPLAVVSVRIWFASDSGGRTARSGVAGPQAGSGCDLRDAPADPPREQQPFPFPHRRSGFFTSSPTLVIFCLFFKIFKKFFIIMMTMGAGRIAHIRSFRSCSMNELSPGPVGPGWQSRCPTPRPARVRATGAEAGAAFPPYPAPPLCLASPQRSVRRERPAGRLGGVRGRELGTVRFRAWLPQRAWAAAWRMTPGALLGSHFPAPAA